jgi:hypothetical protein
VRCGSNELDRSAGGMVGEAYHNHPNPMLVLPDGQVDAAKIGLDLRGVANQR